jgi:hypothetical protein
MESSSFGHGDGVIRDSGCRGVDKGVVSGSEQRTSVKG